MTTQFEIDCALMAGASYYDTRAELNRFPLPLNWNVYSRIPQDNSTGFEATTFKNGTDLVISFAGTNPIDILGDQAANGGLAIGVGSSQLQQAADYYLQVKALNSSAHITLTGHSLGGGLAALIGVFFGETAVTFDQAPFAQTALFKAQSLLDYLSAETTGSGAPLYTPAQLSGLTNFIAEQQQLKGSASSFILRANHAPSPTH